MPRGQHRKDWLKLLSLIGLNTRQIEREEPRAAIFSKQIDTGKEGKLFHISTWWGILPDGHTLEVTFLRVSFEVFLSLSAFRPPLPSGRGR
jgi:hypothetical protein